MSSHSSLISLSAQDMIRGLRNKDFSAVELVNAHLAQIEATNPTLNSFLTVTADLAIERAKAADIELQTKGHHAPLLTGLPVAIKDQLVTKGIRTTCASRILEEFIPPYECTAVKKLSQQGAVILGKTNQDEFAMGSSTENSAFGSVKNPWNTEYVPGGSSGGSAVAVCSGQVPLALGTDTGGSIRQPAALTGVLGLKPTYGRVSRYGAVAFASSLDQIGPFARTVPDLALLLQSISGKDELDSTSMDIEVPNYLEAVTALPSKLKLRVGVPKEYFIDGMDKEVEQSVKASLQRLESLGAELVEISLPHTEHAVAVYYIIASAEASSNLARYDGVRYGTRAKNVTTLAEMYEQTRAQGFGDEVKRRILIGSYVLSAGYYDAYYRKAQQVRTLIIRDFSQAFETNCDIIAAPVAPTPAFRLGEKTTDPLQMYLADVFTIPVSLAGLPGLSVPCGLSSLSLPIGLQLIGRPFDELTLLKTASAFMDSCKFDTSSMAKGTKS